MPLYTAVLIKFSTESSQLNEIKSRADQIVFSTIGFQNCHLGSLAPLKLSSRKSKQKFICDHILQATEVSYSDRSIIRT